MELLAEYIHWYIRRQLYRWSRHITVQISRFESHFNFIGKIIHKNFHIIALLCFLKLFIFRLSFPRYIPTEWFCQYIPMILAREKIQSVNNTIKYRPKNFVGNSICIRWISSSGCIWNKIDCFISLECFKTTTYGLSHQQLVSEPRSLKTKEFLRYVWIFKVVWKHILILPL
jgi:hypothetical protein